jgi:hypothetical protein
MRSHPSPKSPALDCEWKARLSRLACMLVLLVSGCGEANGFYPGLDGSADELVVSGVTFKTVLGQRFVGAQNNGGGAVIATATAAQAWETFAIDDVNGGVLESGDTIFIRAGNGRYFQAVNGGGSTLNAASANRLAWESFRVVKATGTGAIKNGDVVGLQTVTTGNWVSAENGGGGAVFAYGAALGTWEQLTISGLPTTPTTPTPTTIANVTLRTLIAGRYLGAMNNGGSTVSATATVADAWERFSVVDLNGGSLTSGDSIHVRTGGGQYLHATGGGGTTLDASATAPSAFTTFKLVKRNGTGTIVAGNEVALQTDSGAYVSAQNGGGGSVDATGPALDTWETFIIGIGPTMPDPDPNPNPNTPPDFGPNTIIFDPSMSAASIQSRLNSVFGQMESNHFGPQRYALLFKPGTYNVDVNVGFYTQVLGLGLSPDSTTINGAVRSEADWFQGNATQNFWRGAENLAVQPSGGTNRWAVSQAAPFRRMHIRGSLVLDDGGWSSGGFMSDSRVDNQMISGSQQQWYTRNSQLGSWAGANWNMVFQGVGGAPSGASWPNPPYTVIPRSPLIREKPFLTFDAQGNYSVFVPALQTETTGITWASGTSPGTSIPISQFHIAKAGTDTAATMNAALSAGKHLIITPGIYHLNDTIRVTNPNTVVLGLGLATLIPDNGVVAMTIADVDGVKIAGVLFDAGTVSSPVLLDVGPLGSSANHAANPTSLHDLFFRVGGAAVGKAAISLRINSANVIGDHFWIWRADHTHGVGWNVNTAANGLTVNGANVTIYGLFVEHYQAVQTLWNANGGRVYFYQSEIPYDVPNQQSWMNGGNNGFPAYKVSDNVTSHTAIGVGVYCFFSSNPSVRLGNAIEVPASGLNGAMFRNMITVSLGGVGEITHIINGFGGTANGAQNVARLAQ